MVISVMIIAIATRIAYLIWPEWTGFGDKTLWDLLELLIIPTVLGFAALLFNKATRDREHEIAENRQREEALQNYLDEMAELLLERELLKKKDKLDDPIVNVAQVRTVTTLRILDSDRRSVLFQFLRDANLADFILVKASLVGADLSNTDISVINLSGANLARANLTGAGLFSANMRVANMSGIDLTEASLADADLIKADLTEANLTETYLAEADLIEADLTRANLAGADLRLANLTEANLSKADLTEAYLGLATLNGTFLHEANLTETYLAEADLTGADLRGVRYNSQTQWPKGFDYENSGAIAVGDE